MVDGRIVETYKWFCMDCCKEILPNHTMVIQRDKLGKTKLMHQWCQDCWDKDKNKNIYANDGNQHVVEQYKRPTY